MPITEGAQPIKPMEQIKKYLALFILVVVSLVLTQGLTLMPTLAIKAELTEALVVDGEKIDLSDYADQIAEDLNMKEKNLHVKVAEKSVTLEFSSSNLLKAADDETAGGHMIGFVNVVVYAGVGLCLLALFFIILPILRQKRYTKGAFLAAKFFGFIYLVVNFLSLAFVIFVSKELTKSIIEGEVFATMGFSTWGYLLILCNLVLLVTTFILAGKIKKSNKLSAGF